MLSTELINTDLINQNDIYVMNPLTRRSIVVGGRVYRKLIRDGYIKSKEKEDKKEEKKDAHKDFKEELENIIPDNKVEELLRDMYNKKIKPDKLPDLIAKASDNVMKEHKEELEKITDDDELYDEIKNLINEELKSLLVI